MTQQSASQHSINKELCCAHKISGSGETIHANLGMTIDNHLYGVVCGHIESSWRKNRNPFSKPELSRIIGSKRAARNDFVPCFPFWHFCLQKFSFFVILGLVFHFWPVHWGICKSQQTIKKQKKQGHHVALCQGSLVCSLAWQPSDLDDWGWLELLIFGRFWHFQKSSVSLHAAVGNS